jgi:hypothetical protein
LSFIPNPIPPLYEIDPAIDRWGSFGIVLAVSLAIFSGCLPPPNDKPDPPAPSPTPANVSAVERTANESLNHYRIALADVCKDLRDELKTKTFKSAGDFFAEWEKRNKATREAALTPYAEAVNAELFQRAADGSWKTDGPIDVAEFDRVLMEAERGLRVDGK